MKIFCYTINNFDKYSIECAKLLLQSLYLNNTKDSFDFALLSNKESDGSIDIPIIIDQNNLYDTYIGFLKYSDKIPNNYDIYIYLDSDILYFDSLSKLHSDNNDFTIVKESQNKMSQDWWYYPYHDKADKRQLLKTTAINAGSFSFKNKNFITQIQNLVIDHVTDNTINNAKLEQSAFNYVLAKNSNFNIDTYNDISYMCQLYADAKLIPNKTLYHFCDFTLSTQHKYNKMKALYDYYTSSR